MGRLAGAFPFLLVLLLLTAVRARKQVQQPAPYKAHFSDFYQVP